MSNTNHYRSHYRCPLCRLELINNPQGLNCAGGHQFDRAKEGYVNLLPVQHKGSKIPGDNKAMVTARRDFLNAGHYQFLQQAICDTIKAHSSNPCSLLDVGCGEGYYTNAFAAALDGGIVYGIDIAKAAIRYAAKRTHQVNFAVASNIKLPFADNHFDIVTKVFAPIDPQQISAVLKPAGLLLSVVPGPRHLLELKQRIYRQPKLHQKESCPPGFVWQSSSEHQQQVSLSQPGDIANLAQMTPFAWKLNQAAKQQLQALGVFKISFDFVINVYRCED